jgi:hypothetical protein
MMTTMPKRMRLILAAATLSAVSAVCSAQAANQSASANSNTMQAAAPIERAYPSQNTYPGGQTQQPTIAQASIAPGEDVAPTAGEAQATPISCGLAHRAA